MRDEGCAHLRFRDAPHNGLRGPVDLMQGRGRGTLRLRSCEVRTQVLGDRGEGACGRGAAGGSGGEAGGDGGGGGGRIGVRRRARGVERRVPAGVRVGCLEAAREVIEDLLGVRLQRLGLIRGRHGRACHPDAGQENVGNEVV